MTVEELVVKIQAILDDVPDEERLEDAGSARDALYRLADRISSALPHTPVTDTSPDGNLPGETTESNGTNDEDNDAGE